MLAPAAATVFLVAFSGLGRAAESGPVARYPCDEGQGSVLRDATGHGNNGTIFGAKFVRFGDGWALQFDGLHDYVSCGSSPGLAPTKAVSVEAWVCPEAIPGAGEAGIVGKGYESFVLTYYTDGQCWWYISGGGNNCHAPLSLKTWHHVVGTFDGATLRLYIDGALADSHASSAAAISPGGEFYLGKSAGDLQYTHDAHFQGLLGEVRLYDRALTPEEVQEHFRTLHLSHALDLACRPSPFQGEVIVQLDTRGLGELPAGATARVKLGRAGVAKPLAEATVPSLAAWTTVTARLNAERLAPGEYEVMAEARDAGGQRLGSVSRAALTWPAKPSWPGQSAGSRVLNNLVTELLNVAPGPGPQELQFVNPRDGWVFVSATARVARGQRVEVTLAEPSGPDTLVSRTEASEGPLEAMRRPPAGRHTLRLRQEGGGRVTGLIVRAIPELIYAKCGADPHVTEYGPYGWAFLRRHVLPNLTTMVGTGADEQRPFAEEWKREGKRWIVECSVPGIAEGAKVTADEAEAYWTGNPGLKDPLLDGVIVDEFWGGDRPQYPAWTEAVKRLAARPELQGKSLYPYCGPMFGAPLSRAFLQAVLDGGNSFALERYAPEQRTEAAAEAYLNSTLTEQALETNRALPGAVRRMVVCFGYFSAPPESLDVDPGVDYKVYLDLQFQRVAVDPAFFGVGGLMTYLSSYADEETVRFAAKLFRHYGIEGRCERMTTDPYLLPHLRNGDLELGLDGWTVAPAEEGSVTTGRMSGYSWLEGRYPRTSQGDTFLRLRRSAKAPNQVSQTIRALQPGRLYSLRAFTSAINDLATEQKLAVSLTVEGAEPVGDRRFQHVFRNCYDHVLPPYDATRPAWLNYHWQVFRAQSQAARLTISDWSTTDNPGGPAGQEIAANFVEVQPYEAARGGPSPQPLSQGHRRPPRERGRGRRRSAPSPEGRATRRRAALAV